MQMLKVTEVAKRLNLSRGKVYRMVKNGIIPYVEFEGTIRIPEELLYEIIEKQLRPWLWKGKNSEDVEDNIATYPGDGAFTVKEDD